MRPQRLIPLAVAASLISSASAAQGVHVFQVDAPSSPFTFSGSYELPPNPLVTVDPVPDPNFTPSGTLRAELTTSGGGVTTGQFVPGGRLLFPDLEATTPAAFLGFPDVTIEFVGFEVEVTSVNSAGTSPEDFSVDALGNFSTTVVGEVVSGMVNITVVGTAFFDFSGNTSEPADITGTIVPTADGFALDTDADFRFFDGAAGASATLDFGGALVADWKPLNTDVSSISIGAGGTQSMILSTGGVQAGDLYIVLGSAAGTSPGTPLGSVVVPLNIDTVTTLTVNSANQAPFVDTLGSLDADGIASAAIDVAAGVLDPALAGLNLDFAYVVVDVVTGSIDFASNAEPLTLVL
ncbi:MAG: hypothetical protein AAF682_11765 [Planctomycetota bacterium]